jgi:general secretion pathway protein I
MKRIQKREFGDGGKTGQRLAKNERVSTSFSSVPEFIPDRGFTLIEVLVAAAVLGIAASALFGLLSKSLFNIGKVEEFHRYELAAQNMMDRVLMLPTLPSSGETSGAVDDSGARWTVSVHPWAPASLETKPPEAILRVAVNVTWPGRSTPRRIELEALKPGPVSYSNDYDFQAAIEKVLPR